MPEVTNLSDCRALEQMPELGDFSLWSFIVVNQVVRASVSLSELGRMMLKRGWSGGCRGLPAKVRRC